MNEPVIAEASKLPNKANIIRFTLLNKKSPHTKNDHTLPLNKTDFLNYASHPSFYTFIHLINKYLMSTVVIQI